MPIGAAYHALSQVELGQQRQTDNGQEDTAHDKGTRE